MRRIGGLLFTFGVAAMACQPAASGITPAPSAAASTSAASSAPTAAPTSAATAAVKPVAMPRPNDIPSDGSCEDPESSCLGVLAANKVYASHVFKPTVRFALPVDGFINQFDGGGDIGLQRLDPAGDVIMFFRDPKAVDASIGTKPEDIAMWISTNPSLSATPFEPVKLGGLRGLVMDVTAAPGAPGDVADCPVQVCVGLIRGDDPVANDPYQWHWDWNVAGPEKLRLYLLTDPDGTVAVVIDSLDGTTFDSLIATWEKVAPTIKFG